jgi:hypothetical protein
LGHGAAGYPPAMPAGDLDPEPSLDAELLAAEVAERLDEFLDHMSVAEGIGAKLNRALLAFLKAEVLPQANRAAEMGVDPTPLFAVVVRVLRTYADALQSPSSLDGETTAWSRPPADGR